MHIELDDLSRPEIAELLQEHHCLCIRRRKVCTHCRLKVYAARTLPKGFRIAERDADEWKPGWSTGKGSGTAIIRCIALGRSGRGLAAEFSALNISLARAARAQLK